MSSCRSPLQGVHACNLSDGTPQLHSLTGRVRTGYDELADARKTGTHQVSNSHIADSRCPSLSGQFASRRSSSPPGDGHPSRSEHDGRRSPVARRHGSWSRSISRSASPRRPRSISRSDGSVSRDSFPGSGERGEYNGPHYRDPQSNWRGGSDRNSDLCTIYVGGLPYDIHQEELHSYFERYGEVTKVKLIKDHETQEFRGFGFVSFRSTFAAEDATEDANGKEALGGRLKVNIAKYKGTAPNTRRDERMQNYDHGGDHGGLYRSQNAARPRDTSYDYGSPRGSPGRQRAHWSPSPKRRRRSSDYEGRYNGDADDPDHVTSELRRTKEELQTMQREREQAQREYKDIKQQLDELTAQANTKLSDQRSKMKVSKRRSMLRGKQLMGLVEATNQVRTCQEAVEEAEKALREAKAHLMVVLGQAQEYITTEQAEDEAADREREAANEAKRHSAAGNVTTNSATQPASTHSTPIAAAGGSSLALKPFKISLDAL